MTARVQGQGARPDLAPNPAWMDEAYSRWHARFAELRAETLTLLHQLPAAPLPPVQRDAADAPAAELFQVPSSRKENVYYEVRLVDGRGECSCPGFTKWYRGQVCSHIVEALRMRRQREIEASK